MLFWPWKTIWGIKALENYMRYQGPGKLYEVSMPWKTIWGIKLIFCFHFAGFFAFDLLDVLILILGAHCSIVLVSVAFIINVHPDIDGQSLVLVLCSVFFNYPQAAGLFLHLASCLKLTSHLLSRKRFNKFKINWLVKKLNILEIPN